MGGGEDAEVDLALLVRAHRAHDAPLENVEQLGLERGRHLANLVEEERSAGRPPRRAPRGRSSRR